MARGDEEMFKQTVKQPAAGYSDSFKTEAEVKAAFSKALIEAVKGKTSDDVLAAGANQVWHVLNLGLDELFKAGGPEQNNAQVELMLRDKRDEGLDMKYLNPAQMLPAERALFEDAYTKAYDAAIDVMKEARRGKGAARHR